MTPSTEQEESLARNACLRLLTTRPRTRAELQTYLEGRGFGPDVTRSVLERLQRVGLVDDEAFAAAWVESRASRRGLARSALRSELYRKGVDPELVDRAVATVSPEQESDVALRIVRQRLGAMAHLTSEVRQRRLLAMLARRGFSESVARRALRVAADEIAADADEDLIQEAVPTAARRRGP